MPIPLVAVGAVALCFVNIGLLVSSAPVFYELYVRIVYSKYMRTIRNQESNPYIRQMKILNAPAQQFDESHDWENDGDGDGVNADESGKEESGSFALRQVFAITGILRDIVTNPLRRRH
jgi:hypothetical protein